MNTSNKGQNPNEKNITFENQIGDNDVLARKIDTTVLGALYPSHQLHLPLWEKIEIPIGLVPEVREKIEKLLISQGKAEEYQLAQYGDCLFVQEKEEKPDNKTWTYPSEWAWQRPAAYRRKGA